jgi:hypothetical protein
LDCADTKPGTARAVAATQAAEIQVFNMVFLEVEFDYGTMMVSPGFNSMFCFRFLPLLTSL